MARPTLTFATFNLYNLQLPHVAMYHGNTYTDKHYDEKIAWTASILKRLDADIIGLQGTLAPGCTHGCLQSSRNGWVI